MRKVSRQEFIRYTSKYMKDLPVVITNRGEDDLILDVYNVKIIRKEDMINVKKDMVNIGLIKYGCGCEKQEGKKVCGKHGRA